jgi:hypothetical protein
MAKARETKTKTINPPQKRLFFAHSFRFFFAFFIKPSLLFRG